MRYIDADNYKKDLIQLGFLPALVVRVLDKQPTADVVEVRHGKWLPTNIPTMFSGVIHECSLCKAKDGEHSSILGYYCWRCGAKMDGERK